MAVIETTLRLTDINDPYKAAKMTSIVELDPKGMAELHKHISFVISGLSFFFPGKDIKCTLDFDNHFDKYDLEINI